ncbi:MAG: hypothetical protein A3I44_05390 [Candidatus Sungbacteria bacterium RIFCSPLOWO2_02_FULL_51_17]|uniref:Pyruvate ferredoxin oxidoreductase n=1 Tax=Candidatus Sungbacteria bacterium RIFCSPHIGHO2_02_FULL_51_29 TaxID=1802273 RepID=A0A1G2KST0_9BACT|nr:MAG: hypothetical protein A2676_01105 [Candidatus Sungbacteria bacterium RIFCSPHIGHO2_01_FULL_51_22]OHA01662.1 MAG: hypothetical protein A3C16_04400 [Candidatus Sungbacteria bacterium RIFCSPHIGHO2_02_FULL_51_29]OHA04542.1 MAG: hypothetical protein A3B29_00055 [Candidatus Sungbacteria bacterium RIFCSPLOWO2_01_FULL_51_34]OHA10550.1 MAG: hypothetical protein A3I44_05390 [Candidatus Sungbacteria bacterium RIFCSPLOWO2_02_FULL_51_17]
MKPAIPTGPAVLTGNTAAAYGFALADIDVFGGYPITPSTEVTEQIAALASRGSISTIYRNTDSELASIALGIGVSTAGGRYGTATSSQGLALMCELLHWATTARLPLVIANVNRSLGAPWSIHPDQTDSLLFRDMFMPQIYCSNVQEVLDMILWAYRLAEDEEVSLPTLVSFDGFLLSHTAENVVIPAFEDVQKFLPPRTPNKNFVLPDRSDPHVMNLQCPCDAKEHTKRKKALVDSLRRAETIIPAIAADWHRIFGASNYGNGFARVSGPNNADVAVITMGSIVGTVEEAFANEPVRVIGLRFFRPFPMRELKALVSGASKVLVIDRSILPDGMGALSHELRLREKEFPQDVYSFVGGFGGQDLSETVFRSALEFVRTHALSENERSQTFWLGEQ